MDGRIADICLVLLIDFPIPSKKREIGGIGIQHLALQPGNAPFTHGDIVPVRLDSLIQRGRQRSERGRAGSKSHTLPYHDGKNTKSEQSPFHDHKDRCTVLHLRELSGVRRSYRELKADTLVIYNYTFGF